MLKVTRWSHDLRCCSPATTTAALVTYMVCLASDGEGCFGDAVPAVFAGRRRSELKVFPVHLPRTQIKKIKTLHTKTEWERGAAG